MIIQGAFVNVSKPVSMVEFFGVITGKLACGNCYVVDPPPGIVMTAAVDWRLVLQDTADAAALSSALWDAFEAVVSPLKREASGVLPGILVQIKNHRGAGDQFVLGAEIVEKEVLAHRIKETVRTLAPKDHVAAVRQEIDETEGSGFWEKLESGG